jgi:CubicO group peptidase (beta-lactamase class C family)
MHRQCFALLLFTLSLWASPLAAQKQSALPSDIDAYVARAMKTFEVPGIALAIVKNGKVLVARGYGVRTMGDPAPVDAETRFGIASNTKAFTATSLGLLVEEGKLDWDAPVIRYLPSFALFDPYVTRELTVRDLLVHRSGLGLGQGDLLLWPASTYTRKELVERLRYLKPARSFRYAYAYDNVLYVVAGELIEAVSGKTWEEFVSSRLLEPLGMSHSTPRTSDAARPGNVARTHAVIDGRLVLVPPSTEDNANPAGGINSGAADMARWLIAQLDSGRAPDGTRLWSPATTRELWTGVTPIPIRNPPAEIAATRPNFRLYALAFDVKDYRGHKIVTHTGALSGYVSELTMVPDINLGIVVLTNQESDGAFRSITQKLLDHFLGAPAYDWVTAYKTVADRRLTESADANLASAAKRDSASRPSLAVERYAATYTDEWYGNVDIFMQDGKLAMQFSRTPGLSGTLEHYQYDTFIVRWRDRTLRADAFVTFALNPDGSIDQAKMKAVSPDTDFSFDFQDLLLRPAPGR